MFKDRVAAYRTIHFGFDIAVTCLAFIATCLLEALYHNGSPLPLIPGQLSLQNVIMLCVIWGILIHREKQSYVYRMKPYRAIFRDVLRVVALGMILLVSWLFAINALVYDRSFIVTFVTLDFVSLYIIRAIVLRVLHIARRMGRNNQNLIVVGTGDLAKWAVDKLKAHPEWGYAVVGLLDWQEMTTLWRYRDIPLIGSLSELTDIIQNRHIDCVIFATGHEHLDKIESAFAICEEMGTQACLMADFLSTNIAKKRMTEFLGRPAILYSTVSDDRFQIAIKSLIDRLGALFGLLVIAPLFMAIAAVIKATSHGPVFFKQVRCGLNGRRFEVFKFRTMVDNAEDLKASLMSKNEIDGAAFKIADDPRITRIGKFLRKTSLDELPQLINVTRGEMSLVGPRPPVPEEVHQFDRWQRRKLSMKPGMTCLWQVGDRNDTTFDEWMKLDLQYIDNWSLWLDTKILLKTIPAVLNATGK